MRALNTKHNTVTQRNNKLSYNMECLALPSTLLGLASVTYALQTCDKRSSVLQLKR